ncbi:tyrosine-type recombinase/integrase [Paenibacillus oleatilyticus]|uniref:tyrosine-type recombinase/integrase n=1 Tax=Paenibacillus oleatilyticus TaxID=2594886 RepID=UPI001C1F8F88|nr:tyrosine-type recombinase/integrase [Paenibacillus oleatilyticus]MBU7319530.1 site-specific integrase [Paenibacillus oleatilyticus]
MKVHEVSVPGFNGESKTRYMLLDSDGSPVIPVIKYLKYLDDIGRAPNTLKAYCYHLKLYFEYLNETNQSYTNVNLRLLAQFIGWLRNPYKTDKVSPIIPVVSKRSESTVNAIITCVVGFYDFLMRTDEINQDILKDVTKDSSRRGVTFKPFLYHITKGKKIAKNILKVKPPRRTVKILTQAQIQNIHNICSNIRDKLLIHVLYEGGLRIGEALALWIEDFNISRNSIKVRDSKSKAGEGRIVYVTENTMNLFQEYIFDIHAADFDTNFVFINLTGPNKGEPLKDWAVRSFVKRIKKKSDIDFTPHMLRHTFATELHKNGVDVAILRELLGHAHVQTTIGLYIHPSDETIRQEYQAAQEKKQGKKQS